LTYCQRQNHCLSAPEACLSKSSLLDCQKHILGYDPNLIFLRFKEGLASAQKFDEIRAIRDELRDICASGGEDALKSLNFILDALLSPLTIAAAAVVDSLTKKCPDCAEYAKVEAIVCPHCRYRFETEADRCAIANALLNAEAAALEAMKEIGGLAPLQKLPEIGKTQSKLNAMAIRLVTTTAKDPT
jgi:hypothetical protein